MFGCMSQWRATRGLPGGGPGGGGGAMYDVDGLAGGSGGGAAFAPSSGGATNQVPANPSDYNSMSFGTAGTDGNPNASIYNGSGGGGAGGAGDYSPSRGGAGGPAKDTIFNATLFATDAYENAGMPATWRTAVGSSGKLAQGGAGATYSPNVGKASGYAGEGGGGAGARGGQGSGQQGGGGASGYYASQVKLLSSSTLPNGTQLGGNADVAFISVEVYDESLDGNQEPLIPPVSGNALAAERTVTWTVTRSTTENVVGTFSLTSGIGPNQIGFGPNGETKTSQISSGAVYTLTSTNGDSKNLSGNTLTLSDDDSNPGAISITSDIGRFSDNETWVANW